MEDITFIDGTVYRTKHIEQVYDCLILPDYRKIREDKEAYAKSFYLQYCNTDPFQGKRLAEPYGDDHLYVVQNPAQKPLTTQEMDDVYALPYMRNYHPSYEKDGGIPAFQEVKIQPDQQPRLFWRLQLLRPYLPSGTDHTGQEP